MGVGGLVVLGSIVVVCFVIALAVSIVAGLPSSEYLVIAGAKSIEVSVSKPIPMFGGVPEVKPVKARVVLKGLPKDLEVAKEEVLEVAKSSDVFKKYVGEGYVVTNIILKFNIRFDPSEKVIYVNGVSGGLIVLEKGGSYVYLSVDLESGEVKVVGSYVL